MSDAPTFAPVAIIAAKDIRDATRDRFILIVTLFLALGAVVALISGAIALRTDAATYAAAKETLLALGKPVDQIAAPEFYPLKLLRGAVEQIGIVGAAIAILIGYRAAASSWPARWRPVWPCLRSGSLPCLQRWHWSPTWPAVSASVGPTCHGSA